MKWFVGSESCKDGLGLGSYTHWTCESVHDATSLHSQRRYRSRGPKSYANIPIIRVYFPPARRFLTFEEGSLLGRLQARLVSGWCLYDDLIPAPITAWSQVTTARASRAAIQFYCIDKNRHRQRRERGNSSAE